MTCDLKLTEIKLTRKDNFGLRAEIFNVLKHSGWYVAGDSLFVVADTDPKKVTLLRMIV